MRYTIDNLPTRKLSKEEQARIDEQFKPWARVPTAANPLRKIFSKSQWGRFTEARKQAEYALAKRNGQIIVINTKR